MGLLRDRAMHNARVMKKPGGRPGKRRRLNLMQNLRMTLSASPACLCQNYELPALLSCASARGRSDIV